MSGRELTVDLAENLEVVRPVEPAQIDVTDAAISSPIGEVSEGTAARQYRRLGSFLMITDGLCLAVALFLARSIRFGTESLDHWILVQLIPACLMWMAVFRLSGLHSPQHLSPSEELRRTLSAASMGIVLVIVVMYWLEIDLSRSWIGLTYLIVVGLEVLTRRSMRAYIASLKTRGALAFRTLVIGAGTHAAEAIEALSAPGSGFLPVGYVDGGRSPADAFTGKEGVARLRSFILQRRAECVFVAHPAIGVAEMMAVTQAARREGAEVRVYTHLSGIISSRLTVQPVGEGMSLALRPVSLSPLQRLVKRVFDLTLSVIGLVLAAPLLAVMAAAIRLTTSGPALFRQDRVTEGDRTFSMYKFRTMTADADRHLEEHSIDTSVPFFKIKDDPRLTPVGRFLRKFSLDELPQLFNVVRGEMSLVGPRPLPADQVTANRELLSPRHEVRAGVTGWWQIQGRSDVDPEESLRLDLFYIENWSPTLDLYIVFKTIGVLLVRKGAY